jgi:hypothetical protein
MSFNNVVACASRTKVMRLYGADFMPETNIQIALKLDDSKDEMLASYGNRILKLLRSTQAQNSHYFVAILDDFLGAVYSLVFSQCNVHPFVGRSAPIEVQTVIKRADDIAHGTLRTSGNWMAGFHFNGALFRIAASYHRGLKVVSKNEKSGEPRGGLLPAVMSTFPHWKHQHLGEVYDEVNDLKHRTEGKFNLREVNLEGAKAAIEELLELFELWCGLIAKSEKPEN